MLEQLTPLLDGLQRLSPLVAVGLLCLAFAYRWFAYRETKDERAEKTAAETRNDNQYERVIKTQEELAAVKREIIETKNMVYQHSTEARDRVTEQNLIFKALLREMVQLNANHSGSMVSTENAKLMIEYQWNWFRDETARIIVNSIRNNHFRGQEDAVSRRVYRAWHKVARESFGSLRRYDGLRYPYYQLYVSHMQYVFEHVWGWAVPIYYMSRQDSERFDSTLRDLEDQTKALFDQVLQAHFEGAEDIDLGVFLDHDPEASIPGPQEDLTAPARMADRLKTMGDDSSGLRKAALAPDTIRQKVLNNMAEDRKQRAASKSSGEFKLSV